MTVLGIALLFFLVASHPEATLLTVASLYTVSGPLGWAIGALRRRREPPPPVPRRRFRRLRDGGGAGRRCRRRRRATTGACC